MSRPLRIEYEGAWYHVMNRGRAHQDIFPGQEGYRSFLDTLGEAARRYELEVHAYCLMPNHYHLLVRTPRANLGRTMRHIDGLYTQRHNRRVGTDGPLFRGRYKAILVDAEAYLLSVSRYIHRNPVETSPPLVKRLEDWPWSSYAAFVGVVAPPAWLVTTATLGALGAGDPQAAYRTFVAGAIEDELARYYANQRATPVLGDEDFRTRALRRAPASPEVPRRGRREPTDPQEVLTVVAEEWGVPRASLTARSRGASPAVRHASRIAMRICRDRTELTLPAIGDLFGGVHYSTVSHNIRRLDKAIEADASLAESLQSIMSRLDP